MVAKAFPTLFQTSQFLKRRKAALLHKSVAKTLNIQNKWFLHDFAAEGIVQSLIPIKRDFENALDLFSGAGAFAKFAAEENLLGSGQKIANLKQYEPAFANFNGELKCINFIDDLPLSPESFDLILCSNGLNWVNDLPGFLARISKALKPEGAFFASFIGAASLNELRTAFLAAESEITQSASMRISPMIELEAAVNLLSRAGFKTPVSSVETLCVRYDNMFGLLRDLKSMGETAAFAGVNRPLTRKIIARAADIYQSNFADTDGRVRATFDIISLNGWR